MGAERFQRFATHVALTRPPCSPMNLLEPVLISSLNQYDYCPRCCYLMYLEDEFIENIHTARGTREHERVDESGHRTEGEVRVEYGLPVWSETLGLSGRCDVVEFHANGAIQPIEYKHGKRKQWHNDDVQLTAQALCLEEMFQQVVARGAIFHQQSKRRRELIFTEELKEQVRQLIPQVRALLQQETRPAPTSHRQRCQGCSMFELCQPDLCDQSQQFQQMLERLFHVSEEH